MQRMLTKATVVLTTKSRNFVGDCSKSPAASSNLGRVAAQKRKKNTTTPNQVSGGTGGCGCLIKICQKLFETARRKMG